MLRWMVSRLKSRKRNFRRILFRIFRLAENGQRQFVRFRKNLNRNDPHLDLAGRQMRVYSIALPDHHFAIDPDHPFGANLLAGGKGRRARIDDALREAIMVPQVDEEQAAMVAHAMNPARNAHCLAGIAFPERAAGRGAVSMQSIRRRAFHLLGMPVYSAPFTRDLSGFRFGIFRFLLARNGGLRPPALSGFFHRSHPLGSKPACQKDFHHASGAAA